MVPIRILSLWQPWATCMALSHKLNETRSWQTPYRGLVAIHAAKNTTAIKDADDILKDAGLIREDDTTVGGTKWPLGEILAVVTLVDCVPTEKIRESLTRCERAMGNYSDGRYAWVTKDLRRLRPGIPFRGSQGFKSISSAGRRAIAERLQDPALMDSGIKVTQ